MKVCRCFYATNENIHVLSMKFPHLFLRPEIIITFLWGWEWSGGAGATPLSAEFWWLLLLIAFDLFAYFLLESGFMRTNIKIFNNLFLYLISTTVTKCHKIHRPTIAGVRCSTHSQWKGSHVPSLQSSQPVKHTSGPPGKKRLGVSLTKGTSTTLQFYHHCCHLRKTTETSNN